MGTFEHLGLAPSSGNPGPDNGRGGRRSLGVVEAAQFLRVHPEELRRRAKLGLVPGAKIGRAWVFLEDDLVTYLRSHYPSSRQALRVTLGKEVDSCHFADAAASGGSTFALQTESEYADLLGLPKKP